MSGNNVTFVGNLTADPDIRFTQGGASVANVNIAVNERVYNKQKQEWEDGEALFLRGSIWNDAAENVANSLHKGVRVIVTGKLKQRSWDDEKTGAKRTSIEMDIEEIGASLKFTQVTVEGRAKPSFNNGPNPWGSDDSPF